MPVRVGFAVPRRLGNPSVPSAPCTYEQMVRFAQQAESFGLRFRLGSGPLLLRMAGGCFRTYPEAWTLLTTLLTAIGVSTEHVWVGSMVLAAGFRHPALVAKMATALQELTNGRLILGIGACNQVAEHTAFGFDFDGRFRRLTEYL